MDPHPEKKIEFEERLKRIDRAGTAAAHHAAEASRKLREYAAELKRREGC
jgi:hypothetical protein